MCPVAQIPSGSSCRRSPAPFRPHSEQHAFPQAAAAGPRPSSNRFRDGELGSRVRLRIACSDRLSRARRRMSLMRWRAAEEATASLSATHEEAQRGGRPLRERIRSPDDPRSPGAGALLACRARQAAAAAISPGAPAPLRRRVPLGAGGGAFALRAVASGPLPFITVIARRPALLTGPAGQDVQQRAQPERYAHWRQARVPGLLRARQGESHGRPVGQATRRARRRCESARCRNGEKEAGRLQPAAPPVPAGARTSR